MGKIAGIVALILLPGGIPLGLYLAYKHYKKESNNDQSKASVFNKRSKKR